MKKVLMLLAVTAILAITNLLAGPLIPLTKEQKVESFELFDSQKIKAESAKSHGKLVASRLANQAVPETARSASKKLSAKAKKEQTNETKLRMQHEAGLNAHIDGDYYIAKLMYLREGNFPTLYGEADLTDNVFEGNSDPKFYQTTEKEIYIHYLGQDYLQYQPQLLAVTKVVAIDVKIKSSAELKTLLADDRIVNVSHIGDYPLDTLFFAN